MTDVDDRERGLYAKYRVEKINGKPVGECFVLEAHDPNAIPALRAYAQACEGEFATLAADLAAMADRWEAEHLPRIRCMACGRERTIRDAYDYNPLQVVTGQRLGWYSADDGEVCPECMTKTIRGI